MSTTSSQIEIILSEENKRLLREWQKKSHLKATRYGGSEIIMPAEHILIDKISISNDLCVISTSELELMYTWMVNSIKNKYGNLTFVFAGEEKLYKLISNLSEIHLGERVPSHSGSVGNLMGIKKETDAKLPAKGLRIRLLVLFGVVLTAIGYILFLEKENHPLFLSQETTPAVSPPLLSPIKNNPPLRTEESINKVYNTHMESLNSIYKEFLKNEPELSGSFEIDLSINQQGGVEFYHSTEVTITNYEFLQNIYFIAFFEN